jgi:hypothetical protein
MKIPGYGREYWKKRNFFCLHLQRSVKGIARLIKIDKIWIQPVINVINAEYPTAVKLFIYFMCRGINGCQVQAVIRR